MGEASASAAAAAAAAVHRACYNELPTPLQRYHAQQRLATPYACDKTALYCSIELFWEAPEIHYPSHLLVPGVPRLLLSLFCFVRHKTQIHVTAHNFSASAKSTLHPAYLSRPAAVGNPRCVWQIHAVRCRVVVEAEVRHASHLIYLSGRAIFCGIIYMWHVWTHVALYGPGAVEVQTVVLLLMYGFKSSRLCSLPWQQYGRISHRPVVHLMHHAHCCLRC